MRASKWELIVPKSSRRIGPVKLLGIPCSYILARVVVESVFRADLASDSVKPISCHIAILMLINAARDPQVRTAATWYRGRNSSDIEIGIPPI